MNDEAIACSFGTWDVSMLLTMQYHLRLVQITVHACLHLLCLYEFVWFHYLAFRLGINVIQAALHRNFVGLMCFINIVALDGGQFIQPKDIIITNVNKAD